MKVQAVRVADMLLIGPAMVVGGIKARGRLGALLVAAGVGTVLYNGRNYYKAKEQRDAEKNEREAKSIPR